MSESSVDADTFDGRFTEFIQSGRDIDGEKLVIENPDRFLQCALALGSLSEEQCIRIAGVLGIPQTHQRVKVIASETIHEVRTRYSADEVETLKGLLERVEKDLAESQRQANRVPGLQSRLTEVQDALERQDRNAQHALNKSNQLSLRNKALWFGSLLLAGVSALFIADNWKGVVRKFEKAADIELLDPDSLPIAIPCREFLGDGVYRATISCQEKGRLYTVTFHEPIRYNLETQTMVNQVRELVDAYRNEHTQPFDRENGPGISFIHKEGGGGLIALNFEYY